MWAMTVGDTSCPICAQDGVVVASSSRWYRWRAWLVGGRATGPRLRCAMGHEWTAGSVQRMVLRDHGPSSWLLLPVRAVQVLVRHRRIEPSPLFLLGVGAVGIGFGVVAQVLLCWSWWLVAILLVVVVWLAFLATALEASARDELRVDLMRVVNPTRATELEDEQLVRLVRAAPGPIYGLTDREGLRSIGGHGRSSSTGLTRLELLYGDPLEGPTLRIDTRWPRLDRPDADLDQEREHLTKALWHEQLRIPSDLDSEMLHRWSMEHRREIDQRPTPEWVRTEFAVDGTQRTAWTYSEGNGSVAVIVLDDAIIGIRASGFPIHEVALGVVDEFAPYVDGLTQLRERARQGIPPTQTEPGA